MIINRKLGTDKAPLIHTHTIDDLEVSGTPLASTYLSGDGSWKVIDIPDIEIAGSNGQIQFNNSGSLGADGSLFWDNINKRLGIKNSSPNVTLTVGEQMTPLSFMTPLVSFVGNTNDVSGVQMGNLGSGTVTDFRFLIKDSTDHYFAFSQPGTGNTQ
jgi:hypothetical protein